MATCEKEKEFKLPTREESQKQCDALEEAGQLPEQDEIIILSGGRAIIDVQGPMEEDDLGTAVGNEILCG